jgi:hypothetical protein
VDLSWNGIGPAGARDFGQALRDTQVHTVDLHYNKIGAAGARDFGQALQGTQVHTVDLGGNGIGDAGARDFGQALRDTQVHTVDLSWNGIGAAGARDFGQALQGTQVHTVDLRWNGIGDAGLQALSEIVPATFLLTVITENIPRSTLDKALALNKRNMQLTPYYMALLRYLPEKEREQYANQPFQEAANKEQQLKYAGGIVSSPRLPPHVREEILAFLPLMTQKSAASYSQKAAERYTEKGPLQILETPPSDNVKKRLLTSDDDSDVEKTKRSKCSLM